MPTLSVPVTPFEQAVINRLTNRGIDVAAFVKDRLFTALTNRLGLDLGQIVQAEQQFIANGNATACGTVYAVTIGTQPWTYTCVRIAGHLTDGVAARGSHVAPGPDSLLTSWQDGQA